VSINTELKALRKRLMDEKNRLIQEREQNKLSGPNTEARREGSPFGKREEEATEAQELEKRMALEIKFTEQLTAVEHALDKFERGTYGLCDICGQPIEWARLEALPQASVCMKCKAEQAKNAKK